MRTLQSELMDSVLDSVWATMFDTWKAHLPVFDAHLRRQGVNCAQLNVAHARLSQWFPGPT